MAGDEFVVLFRNIQLADAERACARIQADVLGQDWGALLNCLAVTISIGVAQAVSGEELASVLHRSDAAMYAHKRAAVRSATEQD